MNNSIIESIKNRRSIYSFNKNISLSDDEIMTIINSAVKYTPTAFNSQSGRILVLFGAEHDKLWDLTTEILRTIVPAEAFGSTEQKLLNLKSGYGTILYFEDQGVIEKLQKDYPLYKEYFPVWSEQASGMMQLIIWTALSDNGIGATLQHYNPLIDAKVKKTWNLPNSWQLIAQMPFGNPLTEPAEKEFLPLKERVIVYK